MSFDAIGCSAPTGSPLQRRAHRVGEGRGRPPDQPAQVAGPVVEEADEVVLIDVREPEEHAEAAIGGANERLIPLGEVMSLRTGKLATGPLFMLVPARLVITASASVQNADASPRSLQCVVQVRPVGGGRPRNVSFLSHDTLGPNESRTVTLTTGVAVSPGSYDVALLCASVLANPGGKVLAADLTVTAFAL